MRPITAIVIHCSASRNGDARVTADEISRWHREKGWRAIGYHYVIHVDGALYAGRPLAEAGAHVAGNNAWSLGICLVGTDRFSTAQWETLRDLVRNLQGQFQAARVVGHRDYSPDLNGDGIIDPWEHFKQCPGFDVAEWRLSGMDPMWNPNHLLQGATV